MIARSEHPIDSLLDLPAPERLPWREALAGLGFAGLIVLLSGLFG